MLQKSHYSMEWTFDLFFVHFFVQPKFCLFVFIYGDYQSVILDYCVMLYKLIILNGMHRLIQVQHSCSFMHLQ